MPGPYPAGYAATGEDFEIITSQRGRRGINFMTKGDDAVNQEWRQQGVLYSESSYGTEGLQEGNIDFWDPR